MQVAVCPATPSADCIMAAAVQVVPSLPALPCPGWCLSQQHPRVPLCMIFMRLLLQRCESSLPVPACCLCVLVCFSHGVF